MEGRPSCARSASIHRSVTVPRLPPIPEKGLCALLEDNWRTVHQAPERP